MTRIASRVFVIAAAISVLLLVVFLVIQWTGVWASQVNEPQDFHRFADRSTVTEILFDWEDSDEVTAKSEKLLRKRNGSKKGETFSSKSDLEYVQLKKITGDYEVLAEVSRVRSGHFRHATGEFWDLHPQYKFTAFGRQFHLRLSHDNSFVSPNIKVTHMTEDTTTKEYHPGNELGCFYSGTVEGDPSSAVTVSLCYGMTGHVRTSTGTYVIKPTEPWPKDDKDSTEFSLEHAIQRMRPRAMHRDRSSDVASGSKTSHCGLMDGDNAAPSLDASENKVSFDGRRKRRSPAESQRRTLDDSRNEYGQFVGQGEEHQNFLRNDGRYYSVEQRQNDPSEEYGQDSEMESDPSVTWRPRRAQGREYFIEIMVAADAEMMRYHGEHLSSYILGLMNTVSRLYKEPSIGNAINISVVKIIRVDAMFGTRRNTSSGIAASDMLSNFCRWQKAQNLSELRHERYDTALLLTREDLCYNADEKYCDTLGLAELGRMCDPRSSCAIVQDNGLAAVFTIAHEIGHVLNMPHDDDETKCASSNSSKLHNIMSRMLDTSPWEWSKCSRDYVTEFLESGHGHCLLDEPTKPLEPQDPTRFLGEYYSVDRQCELVYGRGWRRCPMIKTEHVCNKLWCSTMTLEGLGQCRDPHMPWADGTYCGENKWCQRGECVPRKRLRPIDGQWGEWGPYGKCSRTCGGGIKKKYRECNSPSPQNYGKYCVGDRFKYKSCGTRECPPGSRDFREVQCSSYNNKNLNLSGAPTNAKWYPTYKQIAPHERCKLICHVHINQSFTLKEKVIDGTPCGKDTFHICVNGQCKPAGCDHILNSTAEKDICGVCKGDNSTCEWVTGTYNSTAGGYRTVTTIPAGSRNIDIKQYGWMNMEDDQNYLALRLGESEKYILNGNHQVMAKGVFKEAGITIEYSGPTAVVERVNSTDAISTNLTLQVLSTEIANPPQITYEYTVPRKILDRYTWVLNDDWTNCSLPCQGMTYRKAECKSIEHRHVVSDVYCRKSEKPREKSETCHNHCILEWNERVSECSNHCGPGIQTVTSRCVQRLLIRPFHLIPIYDISCAHLQRPNDTRPCTGPCEDAHWDYGEWSACDVTCGTGLQYRSATCVDSNRREVSEENCMRQRKDLERPCAQHSCPKWAVANWTDCSVTCGIGVQRATFVCHIDHRIVSNSFCGNPPREIIKSCNAGSCEEWHAGDWSPCTVSCGEGTKRRKVMCKDDNGLRSNRCSDSDKPDDIAVCILKSCPTVVSETPIKYSSDPPYEVPSQQDNEVHDIIFRSGYKWHVESRKCSSPCLEGYMQTPVTCVSIETGTIAPDDYCDNEKKPPTEIPCNRYHCPMWHASEWAQCNVECGTGHQYRQVICQSPNGDLLQDEKCHDSEKPEIVKLCRKRPCAHNNDRRNRLETNILRKWRTSPWTPCSKSCGTGTQRRRVECTMRRGNHGPEVTVKDEHCSRLGLKKPRAQRPCRRFACNYIWQEGAWSEVSSYLAAMIYRSRSPLVIHFNRVCLNCLGFIEFIDRFTETQSSRSFIDRNCYLKQITQCSHACGQKGRETRKVICVNRDGQKVSASHCPRQFKPQRKQRCNQRKCHAMSCLEAKKYFNAYKDGEYNLVVGGRNMSIYCYRMETNEPKEYLTLLAGHQENYAAIYDETLNNPYLCPRSGSRNQNCNCNNSGKTTFGRVRIDPVDLSVIGNDYTFSRTTGSNRVEYGTAGDCNNVAYCPQGRFSINLSGTQLKLSSSVSWTTTTFRTSSEVHKISNQHVVGKCGGYCGYCKPKNGLKLDVLPP
ncbi:A disintegrin and metalloproteinase with thrombospondin motifs 9-like [Ceratina calcarata]|uniref:A disintegrin and metalloproteinase with thrombospondin motifs 9-like n=1 Tax=Ceratina calcarata TaxID=156304 RepID=A0AAJ7S7L4_9HYME|nr:A disintegrin and metalloproteinase with thrombospondin motifs 9-like [Ceratina calcarata]